MKKTDGEKWLFKIGIWYDIFVVLYFGVILFYAYGKFPGIKKSRNASSIDSVEKIIYGGIILFAIQIFKFVVFWVWGDIEIKDKNDTLVISSNGKPIKRNFFIHSYRKYLTIDNTDNTIGDSKIYDKWRLYTSEIITILTQILFMVLLLYHYNDETNYQLIFVLSVLSVFILVSWILCMKYNREDTKYIDTIQMVLTILTLVLCLVFYLNEWDIFKISLLIVFNYIILPRLLVDSDESCSDRFTLLKVCERDEECKLSEPSSSSPSPSPSSEPKICVNSPATSSSPSGSPSGSPSSSPSSSPSGSPSSSSSSSSSGSLASPPLCVSYTDESNCNSDNNCYYVKANIDRSEFNQEGINIVDSKTGCISKDNKCDDYSCNSEFYPLNIFDYCCEKQLTTNGCNASEIDSNLENASLDELKNNSSHIKTLYGQEAWSKKVDYDESYRYCESKNRASETDARFYN